MKYLKLYEDFKLLTEGERRSLRRSNIVVNYPGIKSNPKLPPLLLIPGGDGDPKIDYTILAPLLSDKFNLLTFYYDGTKNKNSKEVCSNIAKELKDNLGENLSKLNILGFSMGTSFGFWIIKFLGKDYKGKFICIDAAAPGASDADRYVHNTLKHNTPRRYQGIVLPFYDHDMRNGKFPLKEGDEPNEDQCISFNYSYNKDITKKIEKDSPDFNLEDCTILNGDFEFNNQKEYESWRKSKSMVVEFLDEAGKAGKGTHYPSKLNPSSIWIKGVKFDFEESSKAYKNSKRKKKNVVDFIKDIMKLNNIKNNEDVWVIQDKNDLNQSEVGGKFYCDPNCDYGGCIDFLKKQAKGMVGTMLRNPKDPETLDDNIEVIIIRAGKIKDGELTMAEVMKNKHEFPNSNTKVEILKGVEHFNICQVGASEIYKIVKSFFNS